MADEQADVVIVDDAGTTHRFPAGFDPKRAAAIVRGQQTPPNPVSADEPGTFGAGYLRSIGQTAADTGLGILRGLKASVSPGTTDPNERQRLISEIKNPSGPHDYGVSGALGALHSLTTPEGGGNAIGSLVAAAALARLGDQGTPTNYGGTPVRDALRSAGTELRAAPGAGVTAKLIGTALTRIPAKQTFQDLPLAVQMESLPTSATVARGRPNLPPPVQGNINDLPLARQMEMLPNRGPMPTGRPSVPPIVQGNINDLPLQRQMEMLPTEGPLPSGRPNTPPQSTYRFNDQPLYQQMAQMPEVPAPVTTRFPEAPLRPIEAHPTAELVQTAAPSRIGVPRKQGGAQSAQYDELKAAVDRGELSPNVLAAYEVKYGAMQPMASHTSTIQARPDLVPIGEEAAHNAVRPAAPPIADPATIPLRQPRIDIGAEKVGRQAGLTKEEVRQQTGPILGEEPGSASPILPQKALERIVSDMRQLAPGPEREAYVARATSGKAQWQIENIRRTLQALGLLVPIGVASRNDLMNQLRQRSTDGGSTSLSVGMPQ